MNKLLNANMWRLFKSKIFRAGIICCVLYSAFLVIDNRIGYRNVYGSDMKEKLMENRPMEGMPTAIGMVLPFVLAIVIGLYIGTEYSNGTIRNKLIAGHSRISIYMANLLTSFIAAVILFVSSMITVYALGIPLLGNTKSPFIHYLELMAIISVALLAMCSIFMMLSMLIQSRATGVVTVIVLTMVMFMAAISIKNRLDEPEYYDGYTITDEKGNVESIPVEKNPDYLTGNKRKVYETLDSVLPYNQTFDITSSISLPEKPYRYPLYSGAIILLATAAGIIIFKKRNLK